MKHQVDQLEGALLDAAVAKAEGMLFWLPGLPTTPCYAMTPEDAMAVARAVIQFPPVLWQPSEDWSQAGPIIEREGITVGPAPRREGEWAAMLSPWSDSFDAFGTKPLIAAMRAYVASKLGEEVELP